MNLTFRAARADALLLERGLSWGIRNIFKLKATLCGLLCFRKVCPGIHAWNGMRFLFDSPSGKRVPLWGLILGRGFRLGISWEAATRFELGFWDAFSG